MGRATVRKSEDRRKKQTEREGEDRRAGKDEDSTNLKKKEKRREEARYPKAEPRASLERDLTLFDESIKLIDYPPDGVGLESASTVITNNIYCA